MSEETRDNQETRLQAQKSYNASKTIGMKSPKNFSKEETHKTPVEKSSESEDSDDRSEETEYITVEEMQERLQKIQIENTRLQAMLQLYEAWKEEDKKTIEQKNEIIEQWKQMKGDHRSSKKRRRSTVKSEEKGSKKKKKT